jgi:hypothetical protein
VSDRALRAALAAALGRTVGALERRPWAYASSAPMEVVAAPGIGPLLFKDLGARGAASRPPFLADPAREIAAYDLLPDALDAPRRLGAVHDDGRAWLFLELAAGAPLWQAADLGAWKATARWLARLHATPLPNSPHLLRHDAALARRWLDRALALRPELADAAPAARAAIERLGRRPAVLLHGELYPSNVLVGPGPRVRVVDWATIGAGPAALDLAALTAGAWDPGERARVVAAYRTAAGTSAPDDAALAAARLVVALQWVGWSASWTPPPEHRHDWLGEALELAAGVAP